VLDRNSEADHAMADLVEPALLLHP
jgi:hypothetical protein